MSNDFNWKTEIEAEIIGYQSPIEVIMKDLQTKLDGDCLEAVQSYGFKVNKEELAKALKYDRDQYIKGFNDALETFTIPKGEWKHQGNEIYCALCNRTNLCETNFCPNCGARMRGES